VRVEGRILIESRYCWKEEEVIEIAGGWMSFRSVTSVELGAVG
jgi:hypothetical protein